MSSILQQTKECFITKRTDSLHKHHIFFGVANRKKSDQYGLWVWLIGELHNMSNAGVHFDKAFDDALKKEGQRAFEQHFRESLGITQEEARAFFLKQFGRNYLDD